MPKIKIFLWQMCHNALPVRETLTRRGCQLDPQCPICLQAIESVEHLFSKCPQTELVWELARAHNWLPPHTGLNLSLNWLTNLHSLYRNSHKQIFHRISFLLWSIWKMRNALIFHQVPFQPLQCLIRAKKLSAEWRIRNCLSVDDFFPGASSSPPQKIHFIRWHPPPPGLVKLNFDGSLQGMSAAGGYILRDWRGDIIAMGASNYGTASIVMAESRSLRDGLHAALQMGLTQLHVEGDNKLVIGAFNKEIQVPWHINNIIQDIQRLVQQIGQVRISHIYREANMAADWLARFGHSLNGSWSATTCDNSLLRQIVNDDRIGRTLVRRGV